jgi:hypothetical protein
VSGPFLFIEATCVRVNLGWYQSCSKNLGRADVAKKLINTMKKKLITAASLALIACAVIAAEPNLADQKTAADQKWLTVVQKIAEKGETKISTPSEARVTLLKNWAAMNGYSVEVTKTEAGFKLDVTRNIAKN